MSTPRQQGAQEDSDGTRAGQLVGNQSAACLGAGGAPGSGLGAPRGALAGAAGRALWRLAVTLGTAEGQGWPRPIPGLSGATCSSGDTGGGGSAMAAGLPSGLHGEWRYWTAVSPTHGTRQHDGRERRGQAPGGLTSFPPEAAVSRGWPSCLWAHSQAGRRETG